MTIKKLTKKQELFVSEYLVDLNATQAAIRAGYSKKTACETGNENLRKPNIQDAISKAQNKRLEKNEVNADYVLKRLIEIDEMDVADILDDSGHIKAITQWPKTWRRTISGLDIQELMMGEVKTVLRKIKWPDKVKNLELLGKHIDVQAFKEKREIEGELTVNNLIAEISESNGETRSVLPKHAK
ncbi:MAG: terminase small subunit [Alteromonas sp.]|nr:MAG: terminase small subunit [Alteromonas sp.]